jgi:glycerate dehydrogenase
MNIAILDGKACNPGDLSWEPIRLITSNLELYEGSTAPEVLDRAKNVDGILINKVKLDESTINFLPGLKYIGVTATGYDNVDIQAAKKRNIAVTNVPGYSSNSVSQLVFSLILELTNKPYQHHLDVMSGGWQKADIYSYWLEPFHDLSGKVLGIIGMGEIGQQVAKIANAFGMEVIYHSRSDKHCSNYHYCEDVKDVFAKSDYISLHCPLTESTKEIINADNLKLVKKSVYIINASRGGLANEADLANALNQDEISGAGLDVLSTEPPNTSNPLLSAKNCIITPHIGWASIESRSRMIEILADNIKSYIRGGMLNRII